MGVNNSDTKKALQDQHRAWLSELVTATKLKPSPLARRAGVSGTTITRLLNDPTYDGVLSALIIQRLTETYSVPGPGDYSGGPRRMPFVGLAEAERFDYAADPLHSIIREMIAGRNAVDPWRLKTEALQEIGYLPGDIVLVDLNAAAKPQDAVCAQVYDWARGGAETVFRVYDPPFLVAAARDHTAYKPLLVDNDRVVIKGVVVQSLRPHPLSATR
jgi:hypothetical protein